MMVTGLARISVATMMSRMALNEEARGSSSRTALKPMSSATMSRRCAWDQWGWGGEGCWEAGQSGHDENRRCAWNQ